VSELRTMVEIIVRLALTLQNLLQTNTAFHPSMADESKAQVKRVIKTGP
jgi:hypothetical protein